MMNLAKLRPGELVGELRIDPITRTTLALFAGASKDHNPIHIDIDFARAAGVDDVFAHGRLSMAYLRRLLVMIAPHTSLRSFSTRFTAITRQGAQLTCTARLAETFKAHGEQKARLAVIVVDQDENITVNGEAVIALTEGGQVND